MDNVQIQCNRLAHKLKNKYGLDATQCEALDRAIAKYDYLQNDGIIFISTLEILECFVNHEDKPIQPDKECIFALCEYIIGTIQFYDVPMYTDLIKSNADVYARRILKDKGVE